MANNKNILTNNFKTSQIEQTYYSPSATVAGKPVNTFFVVLSKVDNWPDDANPITPLQTQKYLKEVFKNIFVAKKLSSNNISPVTQRINWTLNTIYDVYDDNADMFAKNANGTFVKSFYVKNRFDQVFKCLWNNNNRASINEPYFQPGSYGTNNIFAGQDGYKWKYMYTIDVGNKKTFMDSYWMPVPIGTNNLSPFATAAGIGDVEVINIINPGTGYDSVNSFIVVSVTGSNTTPVRSNVSVNANGTIQDIIISNPGKDYTTSNVSITAYTSANLRFVSPLGSNATAIAPVSPVGGHGFDPISEFGCDKVMFVCEFNADESGYVPTDIDYRQIGLLVNPSAFAGANNKYAPVANANIYRTTTELVVSSGAGTYTNDETVQQQDSNTNTYFTGTVLSFDASRNIIKLINTVGTPKLNESVFNSTKSVSRTLSSINYPELVPFSGYITYIENRSPIQRSADGIEQFRFVVSF